MIGPPVPYLPSLPSSFPPLIVVCVLVCAYWVSERIVSWRARRRRAKGRVHRDG